jgi:hypothetical protein
MADGNQRDHQAPRIPLTSTATAIRLEEDNTSSNYAIPEILDVEINIEHSPMIYETEDFYKA